MNVSRRVTLVRKADAGGNEMVLSDPPLLHLYRGEHITSVCFNNTVKIVLAYMSQYCTSTL